MTLKFRAGGDWRARAEVTMKLLLVCIAGSAVASLCACEKPAASVDVASQHGRYVGVGIYSPGQPWTKIVATATPKETPAARPIDDQAIIVVLDSKTGEVRGCGDMTGYCVGMNPWAKPLGPTQIPPINLTAHARSPKPEADQPAPSADPVSP
jgi:hypothetical protein